MCTQYKRGDAVGAVHQVLAWPCNQFGQQEPGDSRTISEFVKSRWARSLYGCVRCAIEPDVWC